MLPFCLAFRMTSVGFGRTKPLPLRRDATHSTRMRNRSPSDRSRFLFSESQLCWGGEEKNVDLFPQPRCSYSHYERDKHSHQCWPDTIVFSHKDRLQLVGVQLCWDASLEPSSELQLKRCGAHKESKSRSSTSHAAASSQRVALKEALRRTPLWRARPAQWICHRPGCDQRVCAEQKATGDWSQRSAIGEARREKTRNGAAFLFFFSEHRCDCRRTCWPRDPFSPSARVEKRSGFYKEAGPGVGFKVFACMSLICQGCGDTLTSCQVAAAC